MQTCELVAVEIAELPTVGTVMFFRLVSGGEAVAYNGITWSPTSVISERAARVVSCPTQSFCVAIGGYASTYNGSSWTSAVPVGGGGLSSVSCSIDAEGNLRGVSCPSSSFCMATVEHYTPAWAIGEALTYNGSTWSAPSEIPRAPDRGPFDVGSVSCVSSSFCMAAALFEGAAATFESGTWSAWMPLEINGGFSSVSCPAVSFCVVVNDAGQAFTYGTPPTAPPMSGGAGATTSSGVPPTNPPTRKGKPFVNAKTGEITLEYDFPEAGEAEAYGEVADGAAIEAKHERTKKCKKEHIRNPSEN